MFCKNCGTQIPDDSAFCGKCGANLKNPANTSEPVTDQPEVASVSEPVVAPVVEQPAAEPIEQPAVESVEQPVLAQPVENVQQDVPTVKKKNKKKLVLGSVAAVLAAVIVVVVGFGDVLVNKFKLWTMSPDKYYSDIEGENISAMIDGFSGKNFSINDKSVNSELFLELTEEGKALFKTMGIDITEYMDISKLSVNIGAKFIDNKMSVAMGMFADKTDIVSLEYIYDFVGKKMFANIPIISDDILYFDMSEQMEVDQENLEKITAFIDALDDKTVDSFVSLIKKYSNLAMKNIFDFEKSTETLAAGDVSAKYTCLTADVKVSDLADAMLVILKELQTDKEAEELIKEVLDALTENFGSDVFGYGTTADDAVEEYKSALKSAVAELEEFENEDDVELFTYKAWASDKGKIVGRCLSAEDFTFAVYNPVKGGKQGTEIVIKTEGTEIKFSGTAKRSGDTLSNGEYVLSIKEDKKNVELVDIELEKLDLDSTDGKFDCIFTVKLSSDAAKAFSIPTAITNSVSVKCVANSDGEKSNFELQLIYGDKHIATLGLNNEYGSAGKIEIPSDAVDMDEAFNSITEKDIAYKMFDALEEAGVNSEIIEYAKTYLDQSYGNYYDDYDYGDYSDYEDFEDVFDYDNVNAATSF